MRTRMITRTIKSVVANTMAVNTQDAKIVYVDTYTTGATDSKSIEKNAKAQCEAKGLTFVKVVDTHTLEALYGMTESEFLALAHIVER